MLLTFSGCYLDYFSTATVSVFLFPVPVLSDYHFVSFPSHHLPSHIRPPTLIPLHPLFEYKFGILHLTPGFRDSPPTLIMARPHLTHLSHTPDYPCLLPYSAPSPLPPPVSFNHSLIYIYQIVLILLSIYNN